MTAEISRRNLLGAGSLGLLGASVLAAPAEASSSMTDTEKANVSLVKEYLAAWNDKNVDIDKLTARYIAPMASVRWYDTAPAVYGPRAAAAQAKPDFPPGSTIEIVIHEILAKGKLVVTARTDTMKTPGKPDQPFQALGVYVVKDGKITEYTDYDVNSPAG